MTKIRNKFLTATFLLALGGFQAATAATITTTLGNNAPGFADGSTPPLAAPLLDPGADTILKTQSGQASPFDAGKGSDLFTNLSESWTFNYAQITDTIVSASLALGIVDHDSAATGNQVALYEINDNGLTSALNTEFETSGGADGEYNIYTLALGSSVFADLTNGLTIIELTLAGPGLQTALFGGAVSETSFNGAHLIFSTLTIETRDPSIPAVPIPAAAPLFLSAIAAFGLYRRRVLRSQA